MNFDALTRAFDFLESMGEEELRELETRIAIRRTILRQRHPTPKEMELETEEMIAHARATEQAGPDIGRDFILAGNATFTVERPTYSLTEKGHYTFRVNMKDGNVRYPDPAFFAALLTGPDNTKDYSYLAMVNPHTGALRFTQGSKLRPDSEPAMVLSTALGAIWRGQALPPGYTLHHEGRCGKCGRPLTTPESVKRGIGPECAKQMKL